MAGNQPVDWSELTPDALLAHMAGLTILKKRIDKALGEAKRQYLRTHDADSPQENAVFAGTDAATVLVKRDGEGSYRVDDPLAYADFLTHYGLDCEGQPAVITVNYPTPNAMSGRFLERLIRERGRSHHHARQGRRRPSVRRGRPDRDRLGGGPHRGLTADTGARRHHRGCAPPSMKGGLSWPAGTLRNQCRAR